MNSIHFTETGNGRPLVLLHGFCETSEVWMHFAKSLPEDIKTIVPDLPGAGRSVPMQIPFSIDEVAGKLLEFIEPWKDARPVLIGHSLGGYVTLAMAKRKPDWFAGIGLFHSTASPDAPDKRENRNKVIDFVNRNGVQYYTDTFVPGLFFDQHDPNILVLKKRAARTAAATLTGYAAAMRDRPSSLGFLSDYSRPVLVVAGEHDKLLPAEQLREQSGSARHGDFHLLERAAHMGMLENEPESRKIITDFMNYTGKFTR